MHVTVFYPTTEIVTFHLCGLCTLGVLFLLVIISLGHECQNLLSKHNGMHALQARPWLILLFERFAGRGVKTYVNSMGIISSSARIRGGSNLQCCITQSGKPNDLPTELLSPK